jgi:hypothetical protein
MKSLLILAMVIVLTISLGANHADAMCIIDNDWPDKRCIDTVPPLPLSKSEWRDIWSEYYAFKGVNWMEQQKSEMDQQIKSSNLKGWIESGYDSQNFTNYNVWFYYYVNDQAPAPDGYGPDGYGLDETSYIGEILPPLKQFNSGIPIDKIQCKEGLELVIKSSNGSPACVSPQSAIVLLIRGWSNQDNKVTIDLSAGQQDGSLLVKEIFSDHISGLNFMEYPIAREEGFPITLRVGETASNGCTVELTLLKINDSTATFLKKEYNDRPCPICLSEDTMIDTPDGPINVKELKKGMTLFTQDASGNRNVGTVLETGKTLVLPDHKIVHIVLTDNRELYASPNHPTADGRVLGELSVGDILDGTKIMIAETIPYSGTHTYDILPSGSTGHYWANEILIKSTLK